MNSVSYLREKVDILRKNGELDPFLKTALAAYPRTSSGNLSVNDLNSAIDQALRSGVSANAGNSFLYTQETMKFPAPLPRATFPGIPYGNTESIGLFEKHLADISEP